MNLKVALSLALLSTLSMVNPLPASAVDIQKMMKNYVDKNVLKKGGGGNQGAILNNLAIQRSRIDNDIQSGIQTGKLNSSEASELKNELAQISAQETTFAADGSLNDPEIVQLVQKLEALAAKVQTYIGNSATTSPGSAQVTTPAVTPTPVATPVSSVSTPTGNALYQRIANSLAAGKINRSQANDLFKIENRIHDLESQLRATSGGSFDRQRSMFRELEQLTQSVDAKLLGR